MKRKNTLPLVCLLAFALSGCSLDGSMEKADKTDYKTESVKVYREKGTHDKVIDVRFYKPTPNIPYISVTRYFKEFFKTDVTLRKGSGIFAYYHPAGGYMAFDGERDVFYISNADDFQDHPDLVSVSKKYFLNGQKVVFSPSSVKTIDLYGYGIDIHYDSDEVYAPLSFLSCFSGGINLIQAAYNGKDIYVCDYYGSLTGERRDPEYFKDTYFSVLGDFSTERPKDLIDYTYNQLCMMFDNDRGYTSQLLFGDLNLLSIGLNGILEMYYPSIKQGLLSANKEEYYKAYIELFMGLDDRGHTNALMMTDLDNPYVNGNDHTFFVNTVRGDLNDPELGDLADEFITRNHSSWVTEPYANALKATFGENAKTGNFYYAYDAAHTTAYVGFDSFVVDYVGWDNFFKGKTQESPLDTYGFVRNGLYQALHDGATNFVLDMTCNGGGETTAMAGLVGLFNASIGYQTLTSSLNTYRIEFDYGVDINLDGKWDDSDVAEAKKFEALNVGVLTSSNCFSCGNTFPSYMQQLGYKIMGAKTSGGSCAITYEFTADGLPYLRSSHFMIGESPVGKNLDDGVAPDFDIASVVASALGENSLSLEEAAPYFYDLGLISNYLETAYAE